MPEAATAASQDGIEGLLASLDSNYLHLKDNFLVHLQATGRCPHVSAPAAAAEAILQYPASSP